MIGLIEQIKAIIEDRRKRIKNLPLLKNGDVDLKEVIAIREGRREKKVYPDPIKPGGVDLNKARQIHEDRKPKPPGEERESLLSKKIDEIKKRNK